MSLIHNILFFPCFFMRFIWDALMCKILRMDYRVCIPKIHKDYFTEHFILVENNGKLKTIFFCMSSFLICLSTGILMVRYASDLNWWTILVIMFILNQFFISKQDFIAISKTFSSPSIKRKEAFNKKIISLIP